MEFTKKLFLGVNGTCFLIYASLASFVLIKLRGIPKEGRTINIIMAYLFIFLCKLELDFIDSTMVLIT